MSKITTREIDFSKWYLDIVDQAELAENSATRGCMVIKPYGYAIWENIQKILDKMIKDTGHENAYFPLMIPKNLLTKEAKHVDGFAQESAVVTHYRLKANKDKEMVVDEEARLNDEYIIRPTSEAIIYDTYSKWVKSYRDLPILINQWVNVVRWEMRTKPFIRTAEFLWQEGHTVHVSDEEAENEALKMLGVYDDLLTNYLSIKGIKGSKSESEKFAGAKTSYTIEGLMQDKKAIQMCTSHNLGQNFAKAFDIQFVDKDNVKKYAWQTSWGATTRLIGAIVMSHSDDKGLILPPKIAPIHVVAIPIYKNEINRNLILEKLESLRKDCKKLDILLKIDDRDDLTLGEKQYEWEKKGVSLRILFGEEELKNNEITLIRRDTGEKIKNVEIKSEIIGDLLTNIQDSLLLKNSRFLENNLIEVSTWDEFTDVIENQKGFAVCFFDGSTENEKKIKELTQANSRCKLLNLEKSEGKCIYSGNLTNDKYIFSKSY